VVRAEGHRKRGIGKRLLAAAEDWARGQGCVEMASDAHIDNTLSLRAHESLGFEVVERAILFRKALGCGRCVIPGADGFGCWMTVFYGSGRTVA